MTSVFSRIAGTGSTLPPRRVTNAELVEELAAKGIESSDEWITSRSGISARHFADSGVATSDLAVAAARKAIDAAQLKPEQIDLIIVATSTPDMIFPSTACVVQNKLGINNGCAAFDVQAVCSGFVYALSIANNFIRAGQNRNVLVIGAEIFSRLLDFSDRGTCVLFGDGAGAVVLTASEQPGIVASKLHADGSHAGILCVPRAADAGAIAGSDFLHMDGQAVFKLAVQVLEQVANETLESAGWQSTELDWLIPHQANIRIMQGTCKKLRLPVEKMIVTVNEHGNTSAASIPLALDTGVRDGRIRPGHKLLLEGVGGGFTWGAVALQM